MIKSPSGDNGKDVLLPPQGGRAPPPQRGQALPLLGPLVVRGVLLYLLLVLPPEIKLGRSLVGNCAEEGDDALHRLVESPHVEALDVGQTRCAVPALVVAEVLAERIEDGELPQYSSDVLGISLTSFSVRLDEHRPGFVQQLQDVVVAVLHDRALGQPLEISEQDLQP